LVAFSTLPDLRAGLRRRRDKKGRKGEEREGEEKEREREVEV